MVGLVKVIFTGDRWGGRELAMLCMMLLILGLPLTGTVMFLDTCGDTLVTSFSITGDELDELVRRRLRGFSSSSEQLTPERENGGRKFRREDSRSATADNFLDSLINCLLYETSENREKCCQMSCFAQPTVKKGKSIQLTIIQDTEKLTFEEIQALNVWHLCLT